MLSAQTLRDALQHGVASGGFTPIMKRALESLWDALREEISASVSDGGIITILREIGEDSDLVTASTGLKPFRMPCAMELMYARASLEAASDSGSVVFDINQNGTSIFGADKLSIDEGDLSSYLSASPPDYSVMTLSDDAVITIDVDTAGSNAAGAKVWLVGRYIIESLSLSYAITDPLDEGTIYSFSPIVSGGVYPFVSFAITSGALPSGLSLNADSGFISGTTSAAGAFSFAITVTDSEGNEAVFSDTVQVDAAPLPRWNPADSAVEITLSSGNAVSTRSTTNDGNWVGQRSVTSHNSGKYFARCACLVNGSTNGAMILGVGTAAASLATYVGAGATSWGIQCNNSLVTTYANGSGTTYGSLNPTDPAFDESAFVAVDFAAGKIWLGTENGTNTGINWAGGGDPAAGTSATYTFTPGTTLYLMQSQQRSPQSSQLYNQTGEGLYLPSGYSMWA